MAKMIEAILYWKDMKTPKSKRRQSKATKERWKEFDDSGAQWEEVIKFPAGNDREDNMLLVGDAIRGISDEAFYYYLVVKIRSNKRPHVTKFFKGKYIYKTMIGKSFLHEWCDKCDSWVWHVRSETGALTHKDKFH